jgi:hypothetical protein
MDDSDGVERQSVAVFGFANIDIDRIPCTAAHNFRLFFGIKT